MVWYGMEAKDDDVWKIPARGVRAALLPDAGVLREGSAPPAPESSVPPAAAESGSVPTEEAPAVDEEFARVVEAAVPVAGRSRRSMGR